MVNHLILVATPQERDMVDWSWLCRDDCRLELCGFGPIVSGIQTARWIHELRPQSVYLVGLAGSYDPEKLPVGSAHSFGSVGCFGVGAGSGSQFFRPRQMGWAKGTELGIRDEVVQLSDSRGALLLTVTSAAGDQHDVDQRLEHFPVAVAEDMEAYAVALACQVARVRVRVIRGISNVAGNREWETWRPQVAMQRAVEALQGLLEKEVDG